ncbi:hypothetical protein DEIPH_ctg017orf0198 [Deinococcus phoenicis]|uniref:N-acetyltransferase domain-containing protein n=1 Tax=Deinococcus phoenicis TaxID=1476583 RepID=A0A016QSP3_9DEIO|nr:GNAT family N-acetyltransferase [Deinococcus phoenicis]EYB68824.1 hypothetical protein DEIPH_ctg017orf0198 [Deinococcus phoenicis]
MLPPTVRPAVPTDFFALRPMLRGMGFVEDEAALAGRFPCWWRRLLGYAAVHDHGPHLRSGHSHRTAKLDDLYTVPDARKQGVARTLMRARLTPCADRRRRSPSSLKWVR